ncbi:MAG: 30S ribosomal protein S6 [Firmicutes bacterium]|nr:30S ribosomal protein S6 [Bacillota bacterium]
MRQYETMFIMKPEFDKEQAQAVVDRYVDIIKNNGGTVDKVSDWGKRRLAYEVKKYREGIYALINFQSEPAVAAELERNFKISEDVIRYLIIRTDDK